MQKRFSNGTIHALWLSLFAMTCGCADDGSSDTASTGNAVPEAVVAAAALPATSASKSADSNSNGGEVFELKPLSLSNLPGNSTSAGSGPTSGSNTDSEKQIQSVISHLQPLQILLGQWRGTTRREFENFKAVDNHEWVWDLRTDPQKPALTIGSDKSPYLKKGRLSWDVTREKFTLTATDSTETERTFVGDFTEPVNEIVGSDDKLHRVFRLEFTQEASSDTNASEFWQLAFAQQENNRYLLEIAKRRGNAAFARYDTVSTQREGTSFAVSDTDFAEKTCIISEGLGTTELTYKGRSYWVCCSGCKAAFEDDPEAWIARAATREKK